MKILIYILIFPLLFSALKLNAQKTKAYFDYYQFYSPERGPYIETTVAIEGKSLEWIKTPENNFKASFEITIIFKKDTHVINFVKDIVSTPEVKDSSYMNQIFLHSNRFVMPKGEYTMSFKLDDLNDSIKANATNINIKNGVSSDSIFLSSIEAFNSFTKSDKNEINNKGGYLISPNIYNFFGIGDSVLNFYTEIYNTKKILGDTQSYVANYYLVDNDSKKTLENTLKTKVFKTSEVGILMSNVDLKNIPTGNYSLVVDIKDKFNKLRYQKSYYFQRENNEVELNVSDISNTKIATTFAELITNRDTISNIIKSLAPISSEPEKSLAKQLIKAGDVYILQQYLYSFWEKRDLENPLSAFLEYMNQVKEVDKAYGTRIYAGYETDRGRVYLQYGAPNSITREYNDPSAYPYELWHYYKTRNQSDVKFIFYNTDLSSNNFSLLHSTAIGEPNNYQWRIQLKKRNSGYKSIDDTGEEDDYWGSQFNKYYENPR